jgi:hypothetical protein
LLKNSTALCPVRVATAAETWNGHECIEALMDSGAGECVCGPSHFKAFNVRADADRPGAGVEYICADGATIPNLGEKLVPGFTDSGEAVKVNFQVCDVDRPLIAVSKLAAAGYDVWFGETSGAIVHKRTGRERRPSSRRMASTCCGFGLRAALSLALPLMPSGSCRGACGSEQSHKSVVV